MSRNKEIFDRLVDEYSKKDITVIDGCYKNTDRACSYLDVRIILFPEKRMKNPTKWDIFGLLHEIGHVETNTEDMPEYEKEYMATQWAANKAREIKLSLSKTEKEIYQDYILEFRANCKSKKGKRLASRESLLIRW